MPVLLEYHRTFGHLIRDIYTVTTNTSFPSINFCNFHILYNLFNFSFQFSFLQKFCTIDKFHACTHVDMQVLTFYMWIGRYIKNRQAKRN